MVKIQLIQLKTSLYKVTTINELHTPHLMCVSTNSLRDFVCLYLPGTVLSRKKANIVPANVGLPNIIAITLSNDSFPEI